MALSHLSLDVRFAAGPVGDFATVEYEPVQDVRAEAYLLGRLGFMPKVFNSILDPLPLWNAIRLMDRLARSPQPECAGTPPSAAKSRHPKLSQRATRFSRTAKTAFFGSSIGL